MTQLERLIKAGELAPTFRYLEGRLALLLEGSTAGTWRLRLAYDGCKQIAEMLEAYLGGRSLADLQKIYLALLTHEIGQAEAEVDVISATTEKGHGDNVAPFPRPQHLGLHTTNTPNDYDGA